MTGELKRSIYPAIIIGSGEVGLDIINIVRARFAECGRFAGGIPGMIKFIHIETRDESRKNLVNNENDVITCPLTFDHSKVSSLVKNDENINKWLDLDLLTGGSGREFDPASITDTRILARLALFSSFDKIRAQIENALESIAKYTEFNSDNIPLGVFVILPFNDTASTAMATDLAYIIRQIVFNKTVERTCEVHGYFLLPDAFCDLPDSSLEYSKINSVAALKEVDLFMDPAARFCANYAGDFAISPQIGGQKPFDFAFLISAVNIMSVKVLEKVICETILHIAGSELTAKSNKHLATIPVSAFRRIDSGDFRGKEVNYSSFGVSSCAIPTEKLVDAYFNKFGSPLLERVNSAPFCGPEKAGAIVAAETEKYLTKYGLSSASNRNDILEMIFSLTEALDSCAADYDEMNYDNSGAVVVNRVRKPVRRFAEIAEEIKKRSGEIGRAMQSDLFKILSSSIADCGERAIAFCKRFCEAVKAVSKPMQEKASAGIENLEQLRKAALEEAASEARRIAIIFWTPWFLRDKSKLLDLSESQIERTNRIFQMRFQKERLAAFVEMISAFNTSLDSVSRAIENIASAMKKLQEKCNADLSFGKFVVNSDESDWLLNYSVVEERHLSEIYEKCIGDPSGAAEDFFAAEDLALAERWRDYGDSEEAASAAVERCVRGIIRRTLRQNLSIEEFLDWESARTGENELQKRCEALAAQGSILWRLDRGLFPAKMVPLNILGTFDSSKSLIYKDTHANIRKDVQIVSSGDPHRITLIQMAHGAPLFALVRMPEWEGLYKRKADRRTVHAITKNDCGADLFERPITPARLDESALLAFFTIADAFEFIKHFKDEGKGKYFLTLDPAAEFDPKKPDINEILGAARVDALANFAASPKLRSVVDAVLDRLGDFERRGILDTAAERLLKGVSDMAARSGDAGAQKQLEKELAALKKFFRNLERKAK